MTWPAAPGAAKTIMTWQAGQVARLSWDARWNTEIVEMSVKPYESLIFLASGASVPAGHPAKNDYDMASRAQPTRKMNHDMASRAQPPRKKNYDMAAPHGLAPNIMTS